MGYINSFDELKKLLAPEIAELKAALEAKNKAPSAMSPAMMHYLDLQYKLSEKLKRRGIRGAELDIALKAIMEIVTGQA